MEFKPIWEKYDKKQLKDLETLCEGYRNFISDCKTERECVDEIVNLAELAGYQELGKLIGGRRKLKAGDKVYSVWMNKSVCMFQI